MKKNTAAKILIFDMDGVLFDTVPYARQAFMKSHPGVTEDMYNEIHTDNYHEKASKYLHLKIKEILEEKNERLLDYAEKKSKTKIFKGMKELLTELYRAGFKLVLNTNAYDRNCLPLLENGGIRNLFDLAASAEFSKDKVEKFASIANKYQVDNNQMLFITDALGDVRDADKARVPTIAVTWGVHDKTYFTREKHSNLITVVDSVDALKQEIKKHFNSSKQE